MIASATTSTLRPLVVTEALMVRTTIAAALCGISASTWRRLDLTGRTPVAVKLGACKLYSVQILADWVADGCPPRDAINKKARPAMEGAAAGGNRGTRHDSNDE